MRLIVAHGIKIPEQEDFILELVPVFIEIYNPVLDDALINTFGDQQQLRFMAENFTEHSMMEDWGYSYGQRLYSSEGVNQIERIVELLSHTPLSKSATITLLDPQNDTLHTPCLTTLDFKIRNNTMIITATFRSQDIGKKMYADALEILKLGTVMLPNLPANKIILIHSIASAHIYGSDLPNVNRIITTA